MNDLELCVYTALLSSLEENEEILSAVISEFDDETKGLSLKILVRPLIHLSDNKKLELYQILNKNKSPSAISICRLLNVVQRLHHDISDFNLDLFFVLHNAIHEDKKEELLQFMVNNPTLEPSSHYFLIHQILSLNLAEKKKLYDILSERGDSIAQVIRAVLSNPEKFLLEAMDAVQIKNLFSLREALSPAGNKDL